MYFLREPTDFKRGMSYHMFDSAMHGLQFKGTQNIEVKRNPNNKVNGGLVTTMRTAENRRWKDNVLARFRSLLKAASQQTKTVEELFREIDVDESGKITSVEFRNAVRKLQLGLTSREIDQILIAIDRNNDGVVDI